MIFAKKKHKKGEFYIKLLLALSLCSVVPMIILAISTYAYSSNLLEEEVNRTNHIAQEQLREKLDMSIENIRNDVLNYLFYDATINTFAYKSNQKNFYLTDELLSDMNELKANHSYIDDVVLYIHDIDFIMNCEGSMKAEFYFDKFQSPEFTKIIHTVGFWKETYVGEYKSTYKECDAVLFSSTLPLNSERINISFAVVIDKAKIRKDIEDWKLSHRGQTFIMDEQGNVIVSYIPLGEEPVDVSMVVDEEESESERVEIDGSSWIKISERSSVTNWEYVTLIPYEEITDKTETILWTTFSWGMAIMSFAIVMSLGMTKKLYLPIGDLIKKVVDNSSDIKREDYRDEFSLLHTNIDQIIFKNKDLQTQVLRTVPLLQQTFFKDILNGSIGPADIHDKMAEYNINMPNKYFAVLLFKGDDINSERLSSIFKNAFVNFYIVENHSYFVAVLNFNECDFEDLKEQFKEYTVVIAQGAIYESESDIVKSYNQAQYAYQYRSGRNIFEYLSISEIINRDYSKYNLSKQYEIQYKNCMDLEKNDMAYEIIRKTLDEIVNENTPVFFRERAIDQMYAFAEIVAEGYGISWKTVTNGLPNYETWRNKEHTIEESSEYILFIFDRIRECRIKSGFTKDDDSINRVLAIIDYRYSEDISLEEIADEMQMSYSYLSKMFKKQVGEGFVEYLTRKRVEASVELLKNEELSIDVISGMVGYLNTPTYIRNFKKVMGVPPGKYRSLL